MSNVVKTPTNNSSIMNRHNRNYLTKNLMEFQLLRIQIGKSSIDKSTKINEMGSIPNDIAVQ